MRAVILAGGRGTRLKPYTTSLPKPLMPIGGELPILEIVIQQLKRSGFNHITLAVNHMANIIMAFFGDGARWGLKIDYSIEDRPLGTIGPLTLLEDLPENFLVMNGDVFTDLNYAEVFSHHLAKGNDITISTYRRGTRIDFGELEVDDNDRVVRFREKPTYNFNVGMGVNILSRRILKQIPKAAPYGFDNMVLDGLQNGLRIAAYFFDGLWLDIGRPEDYDAANEMWDSVRGRLLAQNGPTPKA